MISKAFFLEEFFSAGKELELNFFCEDIRIAEGDRTMLRFHIHSEQAWISFHDDALSFFHFSPAVHCAVKNTRSLVQFDLFTDSM